uniref:Uncharacterized protein n=2 Tax=Fusarium oxysporum (strain Fo5176) TaxID=660025 RepID=A0A0D2YIU5_FUSOF
MGELPLRPTIRAAFLPQDTGFPHPRISDYYAPVGHRFRDLYDDIIIPAAYETLPDHAQQEIPSSYDLIYAKSRAYQENPGAGRWVADDESRTFRLAYSVPAEFLSRFWASVVQKANLHRIETRRGETVAYYQNPRLLFQAHDLKNVFARPNLQESLILFRDNILAGLDPEQLAVQSCWLDVGMRDHVSRQRHGQTPSQNDQQSHHEPWTLLWKSACCRHLHGRLSAIAPEAPLDAKYYRSSLLRDAGIYYAKAKSTKSSNPGHPEFKSPGIIRAKAYNCKKELFGVMFNDYKLFSSGSLPLLAFDEGMFKDLAGMNQNRQRAFTPQLSRSHIKRAWEANKRHLRAISSARRYPNFGIRKEVTFRLDVILAMLADGAFQPDQATHTGPMMQEIMLDPTSDTQHYPFWIVPTRMINDFVSTQAARFILPLDDIFQEATSKAAERYSSPSLNPVRQILAFYTAQLFCRLLIYALSDEDEEQHFDNWIWKSVWSVRLRGREKAVSERRGLGLGSLIDSTGMLWIPQSHIDWQHGHLSLEVLIHLYMARSPLQARLAHQPNVQVLTSTHIVVERLFQEWLRNAQLSHDTNCPEKADEYANKAIALAVEETARAYYQHFLAKLASYWDRVRDQIGRQILPALSCLQRARDESAADTARILSAQTLRKIYCEAWAKYSRATSASGHLLGQGTECDMPDELPCWMATRQRLPPKDSWSDFVYDQFDKQFGIRIGHYIRVMFNTDRSKEVGTAHGEGTWYHGRPPFFQIQFWAPYFSPPQSQKDIPLASVYQRHQYPDGLSPSAMSTIPTARDFQALDELVWEHWVQIVDNIDSLRSASHSYIRRHCRPALLYVRSLSGPTWGSNGDVKFVQPWSVERKDIDECEEEDVFRIPVVYNHIPKHMSESIINQPTIFLPDRDNVMGLLKNIESLPGHSASFIARLGWAMRELDNDGDQYDVRSRLVAKQQALDPTSQSQTLLEQFLRQTEPPEKKVLSPDAVDVLVIIEREEGEEEEEEGAEREAEDDEDDNDEGRAHRGDDIISYSDGISRSLAPLPAILTERDKACDPRASFPQWHSFLSDKPAESLSLHKTQASLSQDAVTITRQWDVDSIWLGAKNLCAIRAPNQFQLSFFSPHKSNLSTDQVIQPHGLDLAHTRHTSIGTFITAGIRFSVLVFFPDGARSKTPASSNSLSLARFRDLYDDIILPAIYETVPDHVKQEIPGSYDLIYAKSRAYQEKPGMGRWSAEDESRSYRLAYAIPASVLSHFWAAVVRNANRHRVQNKKGDAIPYFKNPRLLFQAHDLKNTFATDNLQESLALFRDTVLAGLDPTQIDIHSCWLDIGMRDHVPPETPIEATYYRPYLLRDAGGYYAKAKSTRKSNPGSPEARSSGLIRAKAYNCSKELFGVMFSDYQLFSSGFLPLLAFDEGMLKDLAVTDQSRQRAFVSQLNRSRLLDAWDANKRHMRAVSSLKRHPNFGVRKEVTLRLDVILAMWVRCRSPKSCRRKERRGLGLGDSIRTSGTLWIPDGHINWQTGHISLELLLEIYMSRSPLQAKLAHQTNVQALATSQVTVELLFQRLLQNAGAEYSRGHNEDAEILADRAIALAAEEIARAYHQHFLAKLHSYWDRLRGKIGRQKLPVLDLLQQAQEESAAETGRIPTAQTVHGIYAEAWAKYCQVTADGDGHDGDTDESPFSLGSTLPEELPCWMTTRRRLPPKNSWSDFLFDQIFCRPKPPTWNALFFLQLYRKFKDIWQNDIHAMSGPFDSRFSRRIGYYIQISFNSDQTKEVGTSHAQGTWYHAKPPFFQIQYWAPYFSPPRAQGKTCLSSIYRLRSYPEGDDVNFVIPWSMNNASRCSNDEWDIFYVPVAETHIPKTFVEDATSEPTILLPTRDNIISLLDTIKTLAGHSSTISERLSWTRRRLNNQGNQYDLPSHLAARRREVEPSVESQSLMERFLRQIDPPEWDIEPVDREELDEMRETAEENSSLSEEDTNNHGDDDDSEGNISLNDLA